MGEDRNVDMSEGKNSGQCVCDWSGVYDEQAFEEAMIAYEDELSGYCAELLDKSKLTDTPGHDLLVKLYELHDDEHEEDYNNHKTVGWDELLLSLNTASEHPEDTAWNIFHHMRDNYKTLGSKISRTLLLAYLILRSRRPSLLNSCMLDMALKVSTEYNDFRLPQFMEMWGDHTLWRRSDKVCVKDANGMEQPSLYERTKQALSDYLRRETSVCQSGQKMIVMYAVKTFERVSQGKKTWSVKMVAGDGQKLFVEGQLFDRNLSVIQGRLYEVVVDKLDGGGYRAVSVRLSPRAVEEVFPIAVGYVESYDSSHGHYHIYDSFSRHFVADSPLIDIKVGNYVRFCPVIARNDKFKSAAVTSVFSPQDGRVRFGMCAAEIIRVDRMAGVFQYEIFGSLPQTSEGQFCRTGAARLNIIKNDSCPGFLVVGTRVRLVLFLKRGSDGYKRNHVVEAFVE